MQHDPRMAEQLRRRQPMFNLPRATQILIAINVIVHLVRQILPQATDWELIANGAVIPARYTYGPGFDLPSIIAPLTFQFLHGGFLHLLMNMALLAAWGAGVERAIGPLRMVVFYLVCGGAGALAHVLLYPESMVPMIGASAGISGLFAGVLIIMRRHRASGGAILPLALLWIATAVITGIWGTPGAEGESVAWVAHIGGFLAGLALFPFAMPRR
ncbi:rhomboid family intramembrane serine protease [Tistrella mobilis]|uniref:rhomboid family intramembrane serine protease n=1 Tax=Tistrella mobilis TaxID=171437 RepID=UPI003558BCAF